MRDSRALLAASLSRSVLSTSRNTARATAKVSDATDTTGALRRLANVLTHTALARTTLRGAGFTLRPATLDDLAWTVRLQAARDPSEPPNEGQIRHWWQSPDPEYIDDRWIVEEGDAPIGYAQLGHPAWEIAPMRAARLVAWFPRDAQRPERIGRALDVLEPYAITDGAALFM